MPDRPAVPAPSTTYTYDASGRFWIVTVSYVGACWSYVTFIDPSGAAP